MHTLKELKNNYNLIEILDEDFLDKVPKDFEMKAPVEGDLVIKFKMNIVKNMRVSVYAFLEDVTGQIEVYYYYPDTYTFECIVIANLKDVTNVEKIKWIYLSKMANEKSAIATILIVFDAMAYISYKLANKKTVYKKENIIKNKKSNNKNNNSSSRKKVSVLNEDKVVYLNISSSDSDFLKQLRNYTRKTESWSVLGHYRQLKSGKKIWVSPHKKGSKKAKIEPKKYIVKE